MQFPTSEVSSAAERQHYAVERRRNRGLLGRKRGTAAFFVVILILTAVGGLLERGDIVLGLALAGALLVLEIVVALIHHARPERQPIIDTIAGVVEIEDEAEMPNARWFVGEQRVHLPPHWQGLLPAGAHVRLRVARPPGERLAFALAIDGRCSVDAERARGLPPAPSDQPAIVLLLVTSALVVGSGLLIGTLQFSLGRASFDEGLGVLAAVAAEEHEGTVADFEATGLPAEGLVRITDATALPLKWIVAAPPEAGWAVLSRSGRIRLQEALEAALGRKVGSIPKPDERTHAVELTDSDALTWRRADSHAKSGPTGRPGNQVMVWLGRVKPFEGVRVEGVTTLWVRADAQSLAFATAALLLALLGLPLLLFAVAAVGRNRLARARFKPQMSSTPMGTAS